MRSEFSLLGTILVLSSFFLVRTFCQDVKVNELPKVLDYGKFANEYGKNYNPLETVARSKLFYDRTIKIFHHNLLYKNKKVPYYLKQNQLIDLTPDELKLGGQNSNPDMKSVRYADKYPDMPADIAAGMKFKKKDVESDSQSVAEVSNDDFPIRPDVYEKISPVFNGFAPDDVGNVKQVIESLRAEPELIQKVASIADLPDKRKNYTKEPATSDQNGVKYVQVVDSNNKNYDMESVISYGTWDDINGKSRGNDYAQRLMMGMDFGVDLDNEDYESSDELDEGRPKFSVMGFLKSAIETFREGLESDLEVEEEKTKEPAVKVPEKGLSYIIDWRTSNCITPPKHQMACDSCYAFAVLAMMEYLYCDQTKQLTDFSPQYVIDCGEKSGLNGCKGGKLSNVAIFIKEFGIELGSMYPYQGKSGQCPFGAKADAGKKNGYLRPQITHWHRFDEISAWYRWLARGPMIVGINMPSDFLAYGGGIHSGVDCVPGMTHAMLLVGSGIEDGHKFWLLKNSYSESWGEGGYFRLAHSAPLRCFDSAFIARANFKPTA